MIRAAIQPMNAAVAETNESMGEIVGGREVPGLTNNAALEWFEEQEPLQRSGSLCLTFAHEQNALRRILDQESFENLPNAVVIPSDEELVVVQFAGGTVGIGGAGGSGSSGGAGSSCGAGGFGCAANMSASTGAEGSDSSGEESSDHRCGCYKAGPFWTGCMTERCSML